MQDSYYENAPLAPKKKKRVGLIVFLVFFFILILPLMITGLLIGLMYKDVKAPKNIRANQFDIINSSIDSLNKFIANSGENEYSVSINEDTINKTIYNEVYKKNKLFNNAENFQKDDGENKDYLLYQSQGKLTYASSGAWLTFKDDNTLVLYASATLLKPLTFKSGLYLYFKYTQASNPNLDDELAFSKAYIGNLLITKGLTKYILKQVLKANSGLKAKLDQLASSDLYTLNLANLLVKFNKVKLINTLTDKSSTLSKSDETNQIIKLLANQIKENKLINLELSKKNINLKVGLNKLTNTEEYSEDINTLESLSAIDIFRKFKEQILMNFTNFASTDKTSIMLEDNSIKKLFRYILATNGIADNSVFKDGYAIEYEDTNGKKYHYDIKLTLPKIEKINNGNIDMSFEFQLTYKPDGSSITHKIKSRFNMQVIFELFENSEGQTNFRVKVNSFSLGEFLRLDTAEKVSDVFKFFKEKLNIKQISDNSFTFDYSFDRFEKEIGIKFKELKYVDDLICVVISFEGALKEQMENIKKQIQGIIEGLGLKDEYKEYLQMGLDLLTRKSDFLNEFIEGIKNNNLEEGKKEILQKLNLNEDKLKAIITNPDNGTDELIKEKLEEYVHDEKVKAISKLKKGMPGEVLNNFQEQLFLQATLKAGNDLRDILGFK